MDPAVALPSRADVPEVSDLSPDHELRVLLDGVKGFAVFMLDGDGRVATWNAGAEQLVGYAAAAVLGADLALLYPPEDVAAGRAERALRIAARDGRHEEEGWRVRQDGSRFWASVAVTALRDPAGAPAGYGLVVRDIAEHQRPDEGFRLAIEAAPTGMILLDGRGHIVLVNAHVEKLFGYPREEVIGRHIEMLVPERFLTRYPDHRSAFFGDAKSRPMGAGGDLYGLRKDGTEVPIEVGLNPLRMPEGNFVLSSVADVSERKHAEREREQLLRELRNLNAELEERVETRTAELLAALKEREVLLQEVHHRVKNNLQMISSLINMHVRALPEEAGRDALEECQTRVQAIALIHDKLYQSSDYARVPFAEYARSLASGVFEASGVEPDGVTLILTFADVALAVDKAIPCGLILNELITNALKHAFPGGRPGTLRVTLAPVDDGGLRLEVADDGVGLPTLAEAARTPTLGLGLVSMLTRQLGARLDVETAVGTTFRLTVPGQA
jgi:PAS domain S-box-containing protein